MIDAIWTDNVDFDKLWKEQAKEEPNVVIDSSQSITDSILVPLIYTKRYLEQLKGRKFLGKHESRQRVMDEALMKFRTR